MRERRGTAAPLPQHSEEGERRGSRIFPLGTEELGENFKDEKERSASFCNWPLIAPLDVFEEIIGEFPFSLNSLTWLFIFGSERGMEGGREGRVAESNLSSLSALKASSSLPPPHPPG